MVIIVILIIVDGEINHLLQMCQKLPHGESRSMMEAVRSDKRNCSTGGSSWSSIDVYSSTVDRLKQAGKSSGCASADAGVFEDSMPNSKRDP